MIEFKPFTKEMGIAAAAYVVLLSLSLILPFTGLVIWILPFPVIAFSVLQSRTFAAALSVFAGLVLVFAGFGWFALLVAIALYFLAWVVGENISHNNSPFIVLITLTLVLVMLELVLLALFRWQGVDIIGTFKTQLSHSISQESALFGRTGTDTKVLLTQTVTWLKMMFPAIVSLLAGFFAVVNVILLRWLLKATHPLTPLLRNWRLPYSVLIVYLVSLALLLVHAFQAQSWVWQSLNNIEFLGSLLIGIQGIAFVWRKLQQNSARYFLLVLLLLAVIVPFVSMVYVILGVMDILNESRRKLQP